MPPNMSLKGAPTCSITGKQTPPEFYLRRKKKKVVSTNERLQDRLFIENPDVAQDLRPDKNQNLRYLKAYLLTALYNFGQFQYSYGNHSGAADPLYHFRVLSTDNDLNTSAHWGKLVSDILSGRWDAALEELNTLREAIESIISVTSNSSSSNLPEPALG